MTLLKRTLLLHILFILGMGNSSLNAQLDRFRAFSPKETDVLTFTDQEGKIHTSEEFKGKILVVTFWATWCKFCIAEIPSLERLADQFDPEDFAMITICKDIKPEKMKEAASVFESAGVKHLKLFFDTNKKSFSTMKVRGLPTTVVFDQKGRMIGRQEGSMVWDHCEVIDMMQGFIEGNIPERRSWLDKIMMYIKRLFS